MQEMDDHVGFVNALCFDEEGSKMYSADSLGNIFVWNVSVSNEPASQGIRTIQFFVCLMNITLNIALFNVDGSSKSKKEKKRKMLRILFI